MRTVPVRRAGPGPQPVPRAVAGREAVESVVAVAAVAALVGLLLLLFGQPATTTSRRAAANSATGAAMETPSGRSVPAAVATPVPLLVLNNSRINGLAGRAAGTFRAGGWPVRGTGNYPGRIPVTTVYYPAGQEAVARQLAARYPAVRRVLPRPAGLPGSGLTVVVTREFRP